MLRVSDHLRARTSARLCLTIQIQLFRMKRYIIVVLALQLFWNEVESAQQQLKLSDSYLPVAMQIIAHLTDQMAFETRDDVTPTTAKPTTHMTTKPPNDWTTKPTTSTTKPSWTTKPTSWTTKPTSWTTKPTSWTTKPTSWTTTTAPPYVWTTKPTGWTNSWTTKPTTSSWFTTNGWWTTKRPDQTTPFHAPGLFAPFSPPKPFYNRYQSRDFLLPMYNSQYTVLSPEEPRNQDIQDPLLAVHQEEVIPIVDPTPETEPLLPPHFDVKISSRSDGFILDDVSEESLQYLSEDVREMIRMAKDRNDERLVDVWERSGPQPVATKAKMSQSNLRLLLLYDLLSRDAKSQKLSDFNGFSPDVMKVLVESSSGGARAQLRLALDKMVQRKDCNHDYANNRAREMVEELGKDESKLSSELRYLQPLVYKY